MTTPVPETHSPSVTVNPKLSTPLKSLSGIYITLGASPKRTPCNGLETISKDNESPFGSDAVSVISA